MTDRNFDCTLLTETDVARQLRVSVAALRKWRVMDKGPQFLKIGSLVRYRQADIDRWLASVPAGGDVRHLSSSDEGHVNDANSPRSDDNAAGLLPLRARA
jgi:predicted DNA-binding transcriptional regulator AlpA